jgi:hypothetical protein
MNRNAIGLTLISLALASGIVLGRDSNDSTIGLIAKSSASTAQEIDLQPFTHVARIPADSDTGTIRFEKAKMVQVPTRIAYTINPSYCEGLAFRDPGGSVDAMWAHTDANCNDEIQMKAAASLSDYIAVRVDPVSGVLSTHAGGVACHSL